MRIIGIAGHKQSGKNTVALIWQLLVFEASPKYKEVVGTKYVNEIEFVKACLMREEDYIPYSHYFTWTQKSFAHRLKEVVCALTDCTMDQLENEEFKNSWLPYTWTKSERNISTYRELLQHVGTELFREGIHRSIWIDLLYNDLEESGNYLIADVRFQDEADSVNEHNGTLIRVFGRNEHVSIDAHISERGITDYSCFQYNIHNDGSLEELIIQVKNIMRMEEVL